MHSTDHTIAAALGSEPASSLPTGGGCIHDARRLMLADGRSVFVKSARDAKAPLLAAEARGLALLSPHIRTPAVLAQGETPDHTRWLALEWFDLLPLSPNSWGDLGRQLATLHAVQSPTHGLDHHNFIGTTPQPNSPDSNWSAFYQNQRLRPQIELARTNGHPLPESEILGLTDRLLAGHNPPPSLLHGDLWSGNAAALSDDSAVVFDPAPCFGDPETDLAMLELFGGPLPAAFRSGYGPVSPDYPRRRPLYNLYHALNHLNLFGSGYTPMVRSCLDTIR